MASAGQAGSLTCRWWRQIARTSRLIHDQGTWPVKLRGRLLAQLTDTLRKIHRQNYIRRPMWSRKAELANDVGSPLH